MRSRSETCVKSLPSISAVPCVILRSPARHRPVHAGRCPTPGQSHDLATVHIQVHAAQRLGAAIAHGMHRLICRRTSPALSGCGAKGLISRPTIICASSARVAPLRRAGARQRAIAQHRYPVTDRHDFCSLCEIKMSA